MVFHLRIFSRKKKKDKSKLVLKRGGKKEEKKGYEDVIAYANECAAMKEDTWKKKLNSRKGIFDASNKPLPEEQKIFYFFLARGNFERGDEYFSDVIMPHKFNKVKKEIINYYIHKISLADEEFWNKKLKSKKGLFKPIHTRTVILGPCLSNLPDEPQKIGYDIVFGDMFVMEIMSFRMNATEEQKDFHEKLDETNRARASQYMFKLLMQPGYGKKGLKD